MRAALGLRTQWGLTAAECINRLAVWTGAFLTVQGACMLSNFLTAPPVTEPCYSPPPSFFMCLASEMLRMPPVLCLMAIE